MGSTDMQVIFKVMIPEAYSALVNGITLTVINIIGYSAMAGAIGGGGLGDLAIRYGYQRFRMDIMIGSVLVIILIVELVQSIGDRIVSNIIKRRMGSIK
jgi:D-methionine transport system permease protein